MTAAAPSAGRAAAANDTSPGRRPIASPVPANTSAKKPTALVARNSAAWRWAARSPGTPTLSMTNVPKAGPPAPPAGSSTLAPCSARPSTSARRHGTTRSNAAHSARTNPSIDIPAQAAVASSQRGSAPASRSRTSSTPGSALMPTPTATAITAKIAARRAMARTSTPDSVLVSGARSADESAVIRPGLSRSDPAEAVTRLGLARGRDRAGAGSCQATHEDGEVALGRAAPRGGGHGAEHAHDDEQVGGVQVGPDRSGRVPRRDDRLEDRARPPAQAVPDVGGQVVVGERLEEAAVAALQPERGAQEPRDRLLGRGGAQRPGRGHLEVVEDRLHHGEDQVGLGGEVAVERRHA